MGSWFIQHAWDPDMGSRGAYLDQSFFLSKYDLEVSAVEKAFMKVAPAISVPLVSVISRDSVFAARYSLRHLWRRQHCASIFALITSACSRVGTRIIHRTESPNESALVGGLSFFTSGWADAHCLLCLVDRRSGASIYLGEAPDHTAAMGLRLDHRVAARSIGSRKR